MGDLVEAYRKSTGAKVTIPRHWLDHPRLGRPFSKTPRQRAADNQTPTTPAAGDKKE